MTVNRILDYAKQFPSLLSSEKPDSKSGVAARLFCSELKRCSEISSHYENLREQEKGISGDPQQSHLLQVLTVERDILHQLGSDVSKGLMLKVALLASSVALLFGISTEGTDSSLVSYGLTGAALSAAALGWRYWQSDASLLQRSLQDLQETVIRVEGELAL